MSKTVRLLLGDQLNSNHSWFQAVDDSVTYVLMEIRTETDYAKHHIQKVVGFFSAMQQFASELQSQQHQVIYLKLNDANNLQSFEKNIKSLIENERFTNFEYQFPDEYRLDEQLKNLCQSLSISTSVSDSEHFMSSRNELGDFFEGKKTFLMESFYHMMRKKHHILMEGDKPLTGKWNYDGENRKKLPKDHKPTPPLVFNNNVSKIVSEIQKTDIKTIGTIDADNFVWPINRAQSLKLLDFFVTECLALFGSYQDAMTPNEWS
ncbi:cryptochrome/photolyase family protein, partial [Flavobacterium sp.]|uniref:cryptochrome/photolyase family protein n=1 Tax=Flavobacterium sp. TaxID=239 RepID=UPI0037BECCCE